MKPLKALTIVFSLLILSLAPLFADTAYDLIETKDGSVYRGIIVETRPGDGILLQIAGGSVLKIAYDNIVAIRKETAVATAPAAQPAPAPVPAPQAETPAAASAATPAAPAAPSAPFIVMKDNPDHVLAEARAAFAASKAPQDSTAAGGVSSLELGQVLALMNQLETMPVAELKKFPVTKVDQLNLSPEEKLSIFDSLKKSDSGTALALNLIMPWGVGSFVQGDNDAGWYQLLSTAAFVLSYSSMMGTYSMNNDAYYYGTTGYNIQVGLCAASFINFVVSYVVGIISPFTYQDLYNQSLKTVLN